jgi:hypothetical protein
MHNILGHVAESMSIRGMEQKEGHHHMADTAGTQRDEDPWQEFK